MRLFRALCCLVAGYLAVTLLIVVKADHRIKTLAKITGAIVRVNSAGYMVPPYVVVKAPGREAISLIVEGNNIFYVGEKGTFEYDSEANPKILLSFTELQEK